ncbi:MAG: class I SAM-dependent methyltransferase [Polyangiaceae bacterium]
MGIYADGTYLANNANWHEEDSPYKAKLVAQALTRAGVQFKSCADIGCGAGKVTLLLAEQYPHAAFTGFDLSPDLEKFWGEKSAPNLSLRREDPLQSERRYDLVVCLDVFEHVEDYFGFLRKLRTKGEHFLFNIPLDMSLLKLVTGGLRFARESVGHLHYFNEYTALETLKDTGYTIETSFLSAAFRKIPPRNARQAVALAPRLLLSLLGDHVGALGVGGYSLVVVAKPDPRAAA